MNETINVTESIPMLCVVSNIQTAMISDLSKTALKLTKGIGQTKTNCWLLLIAGEIGFYILSNKQTKLEKQLKALEAKEQKGE